LEDKAGNMKDPDWLNRNPTSETTERIGFKNQKNKETTLMFIVRI
jgi:hypothetical protein